MKTFLSVLTAASLALGLTNAIAQDVKPADSNAQGQKQGSKDCSGLTGHKLELCLKHGRETSASQPDQGTNVRKQTEETTGGNTTKPDAGAQTGGSQNQRKTQ